MMSNARMLLATVAVATGIAASAGVAGAATEVHHTDLITFTSHVHVTPADAGTGRFVLIGDTCTLQADDAAAVPCTFVGAGTVSPEGGTAHGTVTSERGVINLEEVYTWSGPTTVAATGSATEVLTGAHGERTTGTFVGEFTAAPTDKPNVLLDWGTITVTH